MRILLSLFVVTATVAALVACSSGASRAPTAPAPGATAPSGSWTTPQVGTAAGWTTPRSAAPTGWTTPQSATSSWTPARPATMPVPVVPVTPPPVQNPAPAASCGSACGGPDGCGA